MSNTYSPNRIVLQSDWREAISEKTPTIWAGLKAQGSKTHFFDLYSSSDGVEKDGILKIESSDPNFGAFYNHSERSLRLLNVTDGKGAEFFAPASTSSTLHKKSIYSLDVNNGGLGVSCDVEGNLYVWETEKYTLRRNLRGHCGDIYCCRFFPSGLVILSAGADMQLKIWSVENGECAKNIVGHQQAITDVGIVERGRNILSCSKDGTCRLWDCGTGVSLAKLTPECGAINALSLIKSRSSGDAFRAAPNDEQEIGTEDKIVALAFENGAVSAYSLSDRSKIFQLHCNSAANCCAFLNENLLIFGSEHGSVFTVDMRKLGSFLNIVREDRGAVRSICPRETGFWVSYGDGSVCYKCTDLNSSAGESKFELSGPDCDPVYKICADGRYLYTCSRDAKIRKYTVDVSLF